MKEFYKILHEDQKHYGMQYHLGLNEDIEPFNKRPYCGGGIFFADKEQVLDYLTYDYGTKLAIIEIPENEKVVKVKDKYKAHRVIIKEIRGLWTDENYEWLASYFSINELFKYACENSAFSFVKKLEKNDDYAFRYACEYGYLDVAKWLYDLGGVDIHAEDDWAFRRSCENGHLEVAKWLYDLGGVDIHAMNDVAFRDACNIGYLEVAQWIHSLGGIDIHAYDNDVFEYSPEEVITWLNTL